MFGQLFKKRNKKTTGIQEMKDSTNRKLEVARKILANDSEEKRVERRKAPRMTMHGGIISV